MPLLPKHEAIQVSEAYLVTLYGMKNCVRWQRLKQELEFDRESEFVEWLLDVGCKFKKCIGGKCELVVINIDGPGTTTEGACREQRSAQGGVSLPVGEAGSMGREAGAMGREESFIGREASSMCREAASSDLYDEPDQCDEDTEQQQHSKQTQNVTPLEEASDASPVKGSVRCGRVKAGARLGKPLLPLHEAVRVSDAMLVTLYGMKNCERWQALKRDLHFERESEFLTWLLDVGYKFKDFILGQHSKPVAIEEEGQGGADNARPGERNVEGESDMLVEYGDNVHTSSCHTRDDPSYCGKDDVRRAPTSIPATVRKKRARPRPGTGRKVGRPKGSGCKSYMCDVCGYCTIKKPRYVQHMRIHTRERPYLCRYCPQRFVSDTHQRRHERCVHERERRFLCTQCGYTTGRRDHLRNHVHSRHRAAPAPHDTTATAHIITSHITTHDITAGDITAGDITTGDITAGDITTGDITAGDITTTSFAPFATDTTTHEHVIQSYSGHLYVSCPLPLGQPADT